MPTDPPPTMTTFSPTPSGFSRTSVANRISYDLLFWLIFGIIGLETALGLCITELVDKGILTIKQLAEKMSYNPSLILNIDKGYIEARGRKSPQGSD